MRTPQARVLSLAWSLGLAIGISVTPASADFVPQPGVFSTQQGDVLSGRPALDGNIAVFASYPTAPGRISPAYVYARVKGVWQFEAVLEAALGAGVGEATVALSGNTAIVAWRRTVFTAFDTLAGVVIFERSGGSWTRQANITLPGQNFAVMRANVAIHGNTLIIGTTGANRSTSGRAYVYTRDGSSWAQQAVLNPSGLAAEQMFGGAIAIHKDTVVIGSWGTPFATVFVRAGASWREQARVAVPFSRHVGTFLISEESLGSVAVHGDRLLLGASNSGAYLYHRTSGTWSLQATLHPPSLGQASPYDRLQPQQAVILQEDAAVLSLEQGTYWGPRESNQELYIRVKVFTGLDGTPALLDSIDLLDSWAGKVAYQDKTLLATYAEIIGGESARNLDTIVGRVPRTTAYKLVPPPPPPVMPPFEEWQDSILVADATALADGLSVRRTGVVADGMSALVFVVESATPVTFRIGGRLAADARDGTLEAFGLGAAAVPVSSVTVTPTMVAGKSVAAAVYRAPEQLKSDRADTRSIEVHASNSKTGAASTTITIEPPPLVLVHGLNSSAVGAWGNSKFEQSMRAQGFQVFLADFSTFASDSFDPELRTIGIAEVKRTLLRALSSAHERGVAAMQADVIAHSMGGLMTRGTVKHQLRDFGYTQVNRLITIDTPHTGSGWGFVMWAARDLVRTLMIPARLVPGVGEYWEEQDPGRIGTAHRDLTPGSDAYANLPALSVPTHVIASVIYNENGTPAGIISTVNLFLSLIRRPVIDAILFSRDHDLIVSQRSQLGGLSLGGPATSLFYSTLHSHMLGEMGATENPRIQQRVIELLRTTDQTRFATGLPAPGTLPLQLTVGGGEAQLVAEASRGGGASSASRGIRFVTPVTGAVLSDASPLVVTLKVEAFGGAVPSDVLFALDGGGSALVRATGNGPYTASLTIPPGTPLGRHPISVLAFDSNGETIGDAVDVFITPGGTLMSLRSEPASLALTAGNTSLRPIVIGLFGSEQRMRDLSNPAFGTTYAIADASLAVVTPDGLVIGRRTGRTSLTIASRGRAITVPVRVWCGATGCGRSDVDMDDLDDEWEGVNGLSTRSTTGANGADGDSDNDGLTNLQEQQNGSNPTTANAPPQFSLNRAQLFIGASQGGAIVTPPQTMAVTIANAPGGGTPWQATSDQPWLAIRQSATAGTGSVSVSVVPGAYGAGTVTGNITVTGSGMAPRTIPVSFTTYATKTAPWGTVDTPVDRTANVTGSLAVTGWALHQVNVAKVQIYREAVAAEGPPSTLVFLGTAVLVDGARPDIEAAAAFPFNYRGGWGYLLLTNMLPNQGNGTFALHAIATAADGSTTNLGRRTITCTNATATTPFGAIDTPGQGETVSGTVTNWGWALAPMPHAIALDGSAIGVFVDGLPIGRPTYGVNRADIASLFPGLHNSSSAVGYLPIDTTALSNGVHTIAWVVRDAAGNASGIGSRYFTVQNAAGAAAAAVMQSASSASSNLEARDARGPALQARIGFDSAAQWVDVRPGADGRHLVAATELDRVELWLGGRGLQASLLVGDRSADLPPGSRFDPETGIFVWQPGPGFTGRYNLLFARQVPGGEVRTPVTIVLGAKHRAGSQVEFTIDTPVPGTEVESTVIIAGWAFDRGAARGTGIDAVHVWAYPAAGVAPVFLGAATYGGIRPDVGAAFGDRFDASGFSLNVTLPPGTYDIAVFPHSTVSREFASAKVVRVTVR